MLRYRTGFRCLHQILSSSGDVFYASSNAISLDVLVFVGLSNFGPKYAKYGPSNIVTVISNNSILCYLSMPKVICKKFSYIVIIIILIYYYINYYINLCYIMISGLPYLDTGIRVCRGIKLRPIGNFKMGKDSTPLQYQTNQNYNNTRYNTFYNI